MNNLRFNWRHLTLCVLTVATVLALFTNTSLWQVAVGPMHNVKKTHYPFNDMGARLKHVERMAAGLDINALGNNKPTYTVYLMNLFGLDRSDKIPVSVFFVALFLFWSLWLLRPTRLFELFMALGVLLSPPCLLLIERANDDIIIYSFICVVPLLLQMNSNFGRLCGWGVITALVPMKYYPAAAYAILLHRERSFKRIVCFVLLSIVFLAVLLVLIAQEVSEIQDSIPVGSVFCSFGARLLFDTLRLGVESGRILVLCGLGGILSLVGCVLFKAELRPASITSRNESFFLLGSSMLTFCFFMNGNWDYRMAFLIPTVPLAFDWMASDLRKDRILVGVYFSSMLLTLWPEYFYYLSVLDGYSNWVHQEDLHLIALLIKQAASWVMMSSQMLIAAYILQPDVRAIIQDFRSISGQADRPESR